MATARFYHCVQRYLLGFESFSHLLFYAACIAGLVFGSLNNHWLAAGIALLIWLFRYTVCLLYTSQFPHHFHLQAYTNQFCLGGDKTVTGFHHLKDGNEPFLPFTFRLFQYESFCLSLIHIYLPSIPFPAAELRMELWQGSCHKTWQYK